MAFDVVEELQRAQAISAPLIALCTADQQNSLMTIGAKLSGEDKEYSKKYTPDKDDVVPVLGFDILGGIRSYNKAGETLLKQHYKKLQAQAEKHNDDGDLPQPETIKQPTKMLQFIRAMGEPSPNDEGTAFIMMMANAHRFLDDVNVLQGVMNLREPFQLNRRILLMMGPSFQLPSELTQDVLVIDEPLPTSQQIKDKLEKLFDENDVKREPDTLDKAAAALCGLAEFPIIQAASLAVRKIDNKIRVSIPDLWTRKKKMLEQVRGLQMETPSESFSEIGGLNQAKNFITRYFEGPCKPTIILYIDEIEKMLAGSGNNGIGDSSGTTQDQIGQFLTSFENYKWNGQINVGPPGSGKSMFARAVANTFDVPLLVADLGAAKGSYVGESERHVRALIKSLYGMAGEGGLYCIATCNKLHTLPPELRRRFTMGIWFFDLGTEEERLSIANLLSKKYPTVKNDVSFWKETNEWSGANQRDCFKIAYAMGVPLREASKYIVPAGKQDPVGIRNLRELADGKFLSASYEGPFTFSSKEPENWAQPVSTGDRKFKIK